MKYIKLGGERGKGLFAIVDDDDFDWLNKYNWTLNAKGYVKRAESRITARNEGRRHRKQVLMHREVNRTPSGLFTDHINGNRMDNRKCNLRDSTLDENNRNSMKKTIDPHAKYHSEYKGVVKNRNKSGSISWYLRFGQKHIGTFSSEIAAANAYNYCALLHYGEFAKLNEVEYMENWREYSIGRNISCQ